MEATRCFSSSIWRSHRWSLSNSETCCTCWPHPSRTADLLWGGHMSRLSWVQQLPSESMQLHELEYRGSDHNGDTAFTWTWTKLLIHISVYRINTNFLLSNKSIFFSIVSSVRMRSVKQRRSRRKLVTSTLQPVHHWLNSSGFVFMEMSNVKPFQDRKTTFTGCYGFPPPTFLWLIGHSTESCSG